MPEIGRQIGRFMNEFRRASNEFRSQIESEINSLDKVIAAQQQTRGSKSCRRSRPRWDRSPTASSIRRPPILRPPKNWKLLKPPPRPPLPKVPP